MKLALLIATAPALFAQVGAWTGRLIDSDCHRQHPQSICPATAATRQFAVLVPGGTLFPIAAASVPRVRGLVEGQPGVLQVALSGRLSGGAIAVDKMDVTGSAPVPPTAAQPATPSAAAAPSRCDLRLPDGACYEITVPHTARIRKSRQTRGHHQVVITGTLEGNSIRADSVTIR